MKQPMNEAGESLPESWVRTILGNVTHPRGVKVKPSEMADAPFVGLENVEAHTMRLLAVGRARDVKSSGSYFERGDLLYARLRPYLNKVHMPNFGGLASGEFIVFPSGRFLDNAYFKYFLNQWEFASFATRLNAGDRPRVDFSQLAEFPFPLAPLPEQQRIVAEIEKQLTRLDAAVAALERVRANLKRYRAGVLKTACEGRLVPTEAELARAENRDYEPADRLLQRILAERRARWQSQPRRRRKYKAPAPPNTSNLPELPEGWVWASADQVSMIVSGQTPKGIVDAVLTSPCGVPWYRVGDMNTPENHSYMNVASSTITESDVARFRLHLRPPGTIIFPKRGGAIATNKKRRLSVSAAFDLNTMGMVPAEGIGGYLWWWFHTIDLATLGDGSNVPQINHDDIEQIATPLPPLAEQHRIVAEVERRLSVVQQAEATVEASLKRAGRLRQSILKQAFSGKLVPQDPTDEPASALLARIRAERAAASTPSPSTGEGRGEGVPQRHAPVKAPATAQRKPRRHSGFSRARK